MRNRVLKAGFAAGCVAVIGIAVLVTVFAKNNFGKENLICSGVKIGSIDVGGLTKEEAEEKVSSYVRSMEEKQITIHVGEEEAAASAGEMGLSYPEGDFCGDALAVGKKGNFWKRFREIRKAGKGDIVFEFKPVLDKNKLAEFVEQTCSIYDVKAKDSELKVKNGKLKATKSRTGWEVQVDDTVALLQEAILTEEEGSQEITAVVEQTEPRYTQEEVSKCTDLLGQYSTTYSTYQTARSSNVATAAGRINGTVLNPGKTFSTVKVIKDRTEENGYQSAPEYSSGKVVDGIGGGVCQVSTTLYNAVINAELEVVERSPHSMVVAYVDVSRDAAISGDYKDMKFKNNTDYPVYIMGSAYGGVLSFKIYGHETRPENRKISFESEITDTIQPGAEVVTEDPSLPASYRSVTQSAHVGYRAKLWKVVKVDGVQTDRIQLNTSSYNASPQYVTVGKQPGTPEPSASSKGNDKKKTPSPKRTKEGVTPKPRATAKPKVTAKPKETAVSNSTKNPAGNQTTTQEESVKQTSLLGGLSRKE